LILASGGGIRRIGLGLAFLLVFGNQLEISFFKFLFKGKMYRWEKLSNRLHRG
jgi:hypothetical protein